MLRQPRPSVFNGVPFTFPFAGQSYARRILNTQSANLIADWQFDEISGSVAVNAQNPGTRDGAYVNSPALNSATFSDGTPAPLWDGIDDAMNGFTSSLQSAFSMNEGTFATWMKPDATFLASATGGYLTLLTTALVDNGIQIFKTSANTFFFRRSSGGVQKTITKTISSAVWHHIAFTWSAAANQMIAYVDGASGGASDTAPSASGSLGSARTVVGASINTGSTSWKGNLKYATLWTTPLSAAEILALATV